MFSKSAKTIDVGDRIYHAPFESAVVRAIDRDTHPGKTWVNLGGLVGWLRYDDVARLWCAHD